MYLARAGNSQAQQLYKKKAREQNSELCGRAIPNSGGGGWASCGTLQAARTPEGRITQTPSAKMHTKDPCGSPYRPPRELTVPEKGGMSVVDERVAHGRLQNNKVYNKYNI